MALGGGTLPEETMINGLPKFYIGYQEIRKKGTTVSLERWDCQIWKSKKK